MNDRFLPSAAGGHNEVAFPGGSDREIVQWAEGDADRQSSMLDIPTLLGILYRWRWLFLSLLAATVFVTTLVTALRTPLYRATATLELNPAPAQVVELGASEEPRQADRDYLALQIGLVKSRDLAERVARKLNLGQEEAFLGYEPETNDLDAAASMLMEGLSATGTQSDRIMQLSFVHENPAVAAQVANAYAEEAVESKFERAYEATAKSRAFLQRRLEATRQELERSERALIAYAREANIVNVVAESAASSADSAGGTLVASNLVALNEQLADAQNARIVAQQRFAQAGASANAASVSDSTVQSLEQQRAQLQAEYEQKRERYLPDHPEMTAIRARLDGLAAQISRASGRASSAVAGSLRADLVAAQNRERELAGKIRQLESQLLDLNDRGVRYTILRRAVEANRSLYNSLLESLGKENSSGTKTSSLAIIDKAQTPGAPFEPNVPRSMVLGLLGGLILGGTGAVVADRWRDTIDTPEQMKDLLRLPVLGVIPKVAKGEDFDATVRDSRSAVAEAYHSTRASLQFLSSHGVPKSVLFTSSRAAEGKTSSVIALASDFISVGLSVVVIDADMRKPSLRGKRKDGGLSSVLAGATTLWQEVAQTENPRLSLLHAGPIPPDPTVLLSGKAFPELVRQLENQFDVVIIDGPPVLGLADAPILAGIAEAVVLVVEAGRTRRSVAAGAINRLRAAGGRVAGGILTKFDRKNHSYGYGGYEYEYEYSGESRQRSLAAPAVQQHAA